MDASAGFGTRSPWWVTVGVTTATFMELLDTMIANVALPHIAGGLSAPLTDATWVLTSYLAANAIVLPLSGWLSTVFGRRNYFLGCLTVFTLSSILCGMAVNLSQLIIFRIVQGLSGGGMQPVTQAVLLDAFPRKQHGTAMTVFTVALLIAPILGPTLGGYIADEYSWRWLFYINLPVGLFSLALCWYCLHDPPYITAKRHDWRRGLPSVDYLGLGLIALGLACVEVVLEQGEDWDWLASPAIRLLVLLVVIGLGGAIWREWSVAHPVIELRTLADNNFRWACLLIFGTYMILYASLNLVPQMLQSLMGYDASMAGLVMSPAGIFGLLVLPIVGWLLSRRLDARWLVGSGLAGIALGNYWLSLRNLSISPGHVIWPRALIVIGAGLMIAPLSVAAYMYLPKDKLNGATGLFNLLRNQGASVGVAVAATLLKRRHQFHLARLNENLYASRQAVSDMWAHHQELLQTVTGDSVRARLMALARIDAARQREAASLSYLDCFFACSVAALVLLPFVLLLRKSVRQA
jgi:DHA2 family multidrug resistance protein